MAVEAIQIYGIDVNYIPRVLNNYDELMGEDAISTYSAYHVIDMYIRSYDGFTGDGQFFSMHGLEIRDELTLSVAIRTFNSIVGAAFGRPKEGDLVHFPLGDGIFVIKNVNVRPIFYAHGALQAYDLICEMFEYSGERLSTGIVAVDSLQTKQSTDVIANPTMDLDQTPNDFMSDNEAIDTEGDTFIFDSNNPFGDT